MKNPFESEQFDIKKYWSDNKIIGKFGIPYLDHEFLGIAKSDLVVIGGRSGVGKSSMAKIIYENNDKSKTALFSLENYDGDYQAGLIRKEYIKITGQKIYSREWNTGSVKNIDARALNLAVQSVNERIKGSYIFGRVPPNPYGDSEKQNWTVKTLTEKITWCATHGIELIIIDHLDYLDRDNPNESDNAHITELMKGIRAAQEEGAAVVAFSHLRKPMGKVDDLIVPNENEFIGSSNKVKQATQVVLFAPSEEGSPETGLETWCCIRKNRSGGVKNQAAKMFYLPLTETYDDRYQVYGINYAGTKLSPEPLSEYGMYTKVQQ